MLKFIMAAKSVEDVLTLASDTSSYDLALFEEGQDIEHYKCAVCHKIPKKTVQIPKDPIPKRACEVCFMEDLRYYGSVRFCEKKSDFAKSTERISKILQIPGTEEAIWLTVINEGYLNLIQK